MNGFEKLQLVFEPQLVQEIHQFGIWQKFDEGAHIMDYGKYIRLISK